jgi:hypothetical protein
VRLAAAVCAALVLGGCAARTPAPSAGASRGAIPSFTGVPVMVAPVQSSVGVPTASAEAELVFALKSRGAAVAWVMPAALRTQLQRNPMLDVPVEALPVSVFLHAQVNRVGDPLYGYLRRMAAISGAQLALIPVEVRVRAATEKTPGAIEVMAALIRVSDGRVAWFGVVEGAPGDPASPAALASAADALARILLSNTV